MEVSVVHDEHGAEHGDGMASVGHDEHGAEHGHGMLRKRKSSVDRILQEHNEEHFDTLARFRKHMRDTAEAFLTADVDQSKALSFEEFKEVVPAELRADQEVSESTLRELFNVSRLEGLYLCPYTPCSRRDRTLRTLTTRPTFEPRSRDRARMPMGMARSLNKSTFSGHCDGLSSSQTTRVASCSIGRSTTGLATVRSIWRSSQRPPTTSALERWRTICSQSSTPTAAVC